MPTTHNNGCCPITRTPTCAADDTEAAADVWRLVINENASERERGEIEVEWGGLGTDNTGHSAHEDMQTNGERSRSALRNDREIGQSCM